MKKYPAITAAIALALCALLAFADCTAAMAAPAAAKEENVYVNLSQDGSVDDIYVVNAWRLKEETKITDYGKYNSVKNLSSEEEISTKRDTVTVTAQAGSFFYQGELKSKEIPWEIEISYELDGEPVEAEELAGKNGSLKIRIHVGQNAKADEVFFENYQLEAVVSMDMNRCSNLKAPGASVENAGTDKRLIYSVLAGQEKDIVITADVLDFAMDEITFRGLPMSLEIDREVWGLDDWSKNAGDIQTVAEEFADGADELAGGADALKAGADGLADGLDSLKKGADSFKEGALTLEDGIDTLEDGSEELADGTVKLSDGIYSLWNGANTLWAAYLGDNGAAAGARKLAEGAEKLKDGIVEFGDGVGALISLIRSLLDISTLDSQTESIMAEVVDSLNAAGISYTLSGDSTQERLYGLSADLDDMIRDMVLAAGYSGSQEEGQASEDKKSTEKSEEEDGEEKKNAGAQDAADEEETLSEDAEGSRDGESGEDGQGGENESTQGGNKASDDAQSENDTQNGNDGQSGDGTQNGGGAQSESNAQNGANVQSGSNAQNGSNVQNESNTQNDTSAQSESGAQCGSSAKQSISSVQSEIDAQSRNVKDRNRIWGTAAQNPLEQLSAPSGQENPAYALHPAPSRSGRAGRRIGAGAPEKEAARTDSPENLPYIEEEASSGVVSQTVLTGREGQEWLLVTDTGGGGEEPADSPDMEEILQKISELLDSKETVDKLLGAYETISKIAETLDRDKISQLLDEFEQGMNALSGGATELAGGARSLADGIEKLADGTGQLASGAYELADGSKELVDGTRELADGVSQLSDGSEELTIASENMADGTGQLMDGTSTLADGMQDLFDGISELKDGTDEFKDQTDDLDTEMDEETNRMLDRLSGSDFTPVSFVSDKNTNVELVQFVLKTGGIRIAEKETIPETEKPLSLWQRILKLFGR